MNDETTIPPEGGRMDDDIEAARDAVREAIHVAVGSVRDAVRAAHGQAPGADGEALDGADGDAFWSGPLAAALSDDEPIARLEIELEEGDLTVRAGAGAGLRARGRDGRAPTLTREGDVVRVRLPRGGAVEAPATAALTLRAMPGHVTVTGVHGALAAPEIDGAVALRDVGPVDLGQVGGALDARGVDGALAASAVGGSARLRGVAGDVTLGSVGGGLRLADLGGDVEATVGGGVKAVVAPRPGGRYRIQAGGGVKWHVPGSLHAELALRAGGRVRMVGPDGAPLGDGSRYEGVVGDGGAHVEVSAGGSIRVAHGEGREGVDVDLTFDGEPIADMAERFGAQFEGIAEVVGGRLQEVLANLPDTLLGRGVPLEQVERVAERLQRAAERAAEHVERRMHRMAAHTERLGARAERMADRAERHGGARAWTFRSPRAPEAPRGPAGAGGEAVMSILRMVEAGKLSADEAERLIAALGRSGE